MSIITQCPGPSHDHCGAGAACLFWSVCWAAGLEGMGLILYKIFQFVMVGGSEGD